MKISPFFMSKNIGGEMGILNIFDFMDKFEKYFEEAKKGKALKRLELSSFSITKNILAKDFCTLRLFFNSEEIGGVEVEVEINKNMDAVSASVGDEFIDMGGGEDEFLENLCQEIENILNGE